MLKNVLPSIPTIIPQIWKVNSPNLPYLYINYILTMSLDSSTSTAPTWLELLIGFCISLISGGPACRPQPVGSQEAKQPKLGSTVRPIPRSTPNRRDELDGPSESYQVGGCGT